MYCIHCGEPVVESAKFCAACGEKIQRPKGEEQQSERSVSVDRDVDSEATDDLDTPVVAQLEDSPASVGVPRTVNAPNSSDTASVAKTGSSALKKVGKVIISLVALVLAILFGTLISELIFGDASRAPVLNFALLIPWLVAVWHPVSNSASVGKRAGAILVGSIAGTVAWLPFPPSGMLASGAATFFLCRGFNRRFAER